MPSISPSLLASSLEEAARALARVRSGRNAEGHKRARRDGEGWWTITSEGTGVPDAMRAAISQRIDALKASSARAGLPPAAVQDAVQCLVQAARLGLGSECTTRLLWCLRPRENIQQCTMTRLLASMGAPAFPPALRTQCLRWLLLMLQQESDVADVSAVVTEGGHGTEDSAGRAVPSGQGAAGVSSLASMITVLLRPLYRVLFHMLIAACSGGAAASTAPPSSADRALLCDILLKITSRRDARACWLQIALVRFTRSARVAFGAAPAHSPLPVSLQPVHFPLPVPLQGNGWAPSPAHTSKTRSCTESCSQILAGVGHRVWLKKARITAGCRSSQRRCSIC